MWKTASDLDETRSHARTTTLWSANVSFLDRNTGFQGRTSSAVETVYRHNQALALTFKLTDRAFVDRVMQCGTVAMPTTTRTLANMTLSCAIEFRGHAWGNFILPVCGRGVSHSPKRTLEHGVLRERWWLSNANNEIGRPHSAPSSGTRRRHRRRRHWNAMFMASSSSSSSSVTTSSSSSSSSSSSTDDTDTDTMKVSVSPTHSPLIADRKAQHDCSVWFCERVQRAASSPKQKRGLTVNACDFELTRESVREKWVEVRFVMTLMDFEQQCQIYRVNPGLDDWMRTSREILTTRSKVLLRSGSFDYGKANSL